MENDRVLHKTLGEFRANFIILIKDQKEIADALTRLTVAVGEIQERQEALEEKLNLLTLEVGR